MCSTIAEVGELESGRLFYREGGLLLSPEGSGFLFVEPYSSKHPLFFNMLGVLHWSPKLLILRRIEIGIALLLGNPQKNQQVRGTH